MFKAIKVTAAAALLASVAFAANAATYSASTQAGGAGGIGLSGGNNLSIYTVDSSPYSNAATDPSSDWVWAAPNSPLVSQTLQFVYTFTLTAAQAAHATLSGLWGVDNLGEVSLNGNQIDALPFGYDAFQKMHSLSDMGFLQEGVNTLTFDVRNCCGSEDLHINPAAFRASVTVDAAVPLPAALPLLGGALAAFGFVGARRKRRA